MRTKLVLGILAASLGTAFATLAAQSGPRKVAILHSGKTAVNTESIRFLEKRFEAAGKGWEVEAVKDPSALQPGAYQAIIVLNTGLREGIGKKTADFLGSWSRKSDLILVSLQKDSRNLEVQTRAASPATFGVDAVSAASAWKSRGVGALFGGENSPEYDMHLEWTDRVISLVERR